MITNIRAYMKTSPQCTKEQLVVRVAIPSPLRRLFDYLLPDTSVDHLPVIGARVEVPFGRQTLIGVITEITKHSELPISQLKPIYKILDPHALFPDKLRELLTWASSYYQYPIGLLFDSVLPGWIRKNKALDINSKSKRVAKNNISQLEKALDLNPDQLQAVNNIASSFGSFKAFLLDGVTGSGKTEVYMQLISLALEQDKQALILIPEINLTPQTLQRFEQRFAVPIAVLNSQISEKKRATAWLEARDGTARIVIGTRLAAFTPLKNPGLFIIDEEHDLSFKQQDHFRYSARDLLLKRAQLEECPIVLGTATPALETWHNAITGKYSHLELPVRAGVAQKPIIEIVDIRHRQLDSGLSNHLLAQIQAHLDNKSQVLLFLNRRGYAPVLICFKCGWHQTCKRCDSNMIMHLQSNELRCHHCGANSRIPNHCQKCNDSAISPIGLGTQRIEECLAKHFPQASISRVDRDTVQTKKQLEAVFDQVHEGNTDILIGTQMLAKGHHFPNLSLVAIVDIDSALFSADFRSTERVGQLITQVAGRSGRGTKLGKVILQTTQPEHPMLITLINNGYHAFLNYLMQERHQTKLPPYSYQILIRAESKKPQIANEFLHLVREHVQSQSKIISCLGPIPAPMEKRQGFYRAQLLLQADSRKILQEVMQRIMPSVDALKQARGTRWSVDVDPLDMY